ncbi:uncharacterized protein LOC128954423 [Oppia nitens]|uniref:uncharacterized protein LOC128954423 n=1 Tax=Oppia nitens TaxID=1686743 RepID=UPI0023DA015C|nr:uncharacterized protein LOC128954423 [Oppia nitens]
MTATSMMTTPKDSFDRFGDDLCQLLLTNLSIDDKLRLQSVSKQWLALIFNTETDLVFCRKLLDRMSLDSIRDYYQTIKLFQVIVRKCPNITAVIISEVSLLDRFLDLLMIYCHRLRHICLKLDYDGHLSVIDRAFECFFRQFGQQLLTFKFNGYSIDYNKQLFYEVIDGMPNLKTLDITYEHRRSTVQLNDIIIGDMYYDLPKSLQSLNIKLDDSSVPLFASFADIYGKQLTSLTIVSVVDTDNMSYELIVNYQPLIDGLGQMVRLRRLKIVLFKYLLNNFTGDLFATIGRQCRQLKELSYLSIESNIVIIERMFAVINKHISGQHLKRLSLYCWPNYYQEEEVMVVVDDEEEEEYLDLVLTCDLLNRLHGLTHLTLCFDRKFRIIGDQFFRNIHSNLPRLQYIHCDSVFSTEESIIGTIINGQSSPSLSSKRLDVVVDHRCDANNLSKKTQIIY